MTYTATITSKRQLTIPVALFRKTKLKQGQKIILTEKNGIIKMESALDMVNRLAGSLKLPKKYQSLPINSVISQAKEKYWQEKTKKELSL